MKQGWEIKTLGEVCEVNKSIYGYKSFQVKFYKDGIWTRVRDFFPASRIKLFYNKKNIAKGVYEKVCEGKSWKNKPKMRKNNPIEWRKQIYSSIYTKTKAIGLSKPELYSFTYDKLVLKKPIESLTELTDTNLKKLYQLIIRL